MKIEGSGSATLQEFINFEGHLDQCEKGSSRKRRKGMFLGTSNVADLKN
jgi:hypothetical protein